MNALGGRLAHVYAPVAPPAGAVRFELVAGEPAQVAGLVIVPELNEDGTGFTGAWQVVHHGSGAAVSPPYGGREEALNAAVRLGGVALAQWHRTPYAPPGQETAVAALVKRALEPTLLLAAG